MPETGLGLKGRGYGDIPTTREIAETNFEKVAALAARWSLDPAAIDESSLDHAGGRAGEFSQLY